MKLGYYYGIVMRTIRHIRPYYAYQSHNVSLNSENALIVIAR